MHISLLKVTPQAGNAPVGSLFTKCVLMAYMVVFTSCFAVMYGLKSFLGKCFGWHRVTHENQLPVAISTTRPA